MPWNTVFPLGSVSVKANRTIGQQNTTYIEVTMGNSIVGTNTNTTRDHFWNVGSNEDGRHRFMQSPAFTVGGLPVDPVLGAGMDSVFYSKLKLAAESTSQQDVQPFFRNASAIMQVLGIRACAVFDVSGGVVTMRYSHNGTVTRDAQGKFRLTFVTALPSRNYLILGSGVRDTSSSSDVVIFAPRGAETVTDSKSTTRCLFNFVSDTAGNLLDPLQGCVVVFGG